MRSNRATGTAALRCEIAARALVRALENYVVELVAGRRRADQWIDQDRSPLGRRRHLEAVRAGRIPGFKQGKKVYAKSTDVTAYIESRPASPKSARQVPKTERSLDARQIAAKALEELGLQLR